MVAEKSMRKFIKHLSYIVAGILVLLALTSLFVRWLLFDIDSYRSEVASLLEDVSDAKVEIGALHADWDAWDLILQAKGLKWVMPDSADTDAQSYTVGNAQFRISLLESILAQRPIIRSAHFSDAKLRVISDEARNIHLPEFALSFPADALLGALGGRPHADQASRTTHPSIYAERLTIDWYRHTAATPLRFNDVSWMFNPHSNTEQPRAVLRADLPHQLGEQIHIELGAQGEGYARLTSIDIAAVLHEVGLAAPAQGRLSANIHVQLSADMSIPPLLSGNVVLHDFALGDTDNALRASSLNSGFVWQSDDNRSRFGLFDLSFASPDLTLRDGKIGIVQSRITDKMAYSAVDIDFNVISGISPELIQQLTANLTKQIRFGATVDVETIKALQIDAALNHPDVWLITRGDWQTLKKFSPAHLRQIIAAATVSKIQARAQIAGANVSLCRRHPPAAKDRRRDST